MVAHQNNSLKSSKCGVESLLRQPEVAGPVSIFGKACAGSAHRAGDMKGHPRQHTSVLSLMGNSCTKKNRKAGTSPTLIQPRELPIRVASDHAASETI